MSIRKKDCDALLNYEKRRRERNVRLLAKLENVEKKAAFLQAKTDRIRSLKGIYKSQIDKNSIPISYGLKNLNYYAPNIQNENIYNAKTLDLHDKYEEKTKYYNSCSIIKNITLEEAIEEISRRFILIPKEVSDDSIQTKHFEKIDQHVDDDVKKQLNTDEESIIVPQVSDDNDLNETDQNIEEVKEEPSEIRINKEDDYIENKDEDLSEIEFLNMNTQNINSDTVENEIKIQNEIETVADDRREDNPKLENVEFKSKFSNLTNEIVHMDQMGIDDANDQNIDSEAKYQDYVETAPQDIEEINKNHKNYEEKNPSIENDDQVIQKQYYVNENDQYDEQNYVNNPEENQPIAGENAFYENNEQYYRDQQYTDYNTEINNDYMAQPYQNNPETNMNYDYENVDQQITNYSEDQNQYVTDNREDVQQQIDAANYDQIQMAESYNQQQVDAQNYDQTVESYDQQQIESQNCDPNQMTESYDEQQIGSQNYDQNQTAELYEQQQIDSQNYDQNQTAELYDQQQADSQNYDQNQTTELYEQQQTDSQNYDQNQTAGLYEQHVDSQNYDPNQTTELYDQQQIDSQNYDPNQTEFYEGQENYHQEQTQENHAANEYEGYEHYAEQNDSQQGQYNEYEQQQDSQYYTEIQENDSTSVEQNQNVKPLQIFESDTDQVSTKEDPTVTESDFDFSTQ